MCERTDLNKYNQSFPSHTLESIYLTIYIHLTADINEKYVEKLPGITVLILYFPVVHPVIMRKLVYSYKTRFCKR